MCFICCALSPLSSGQLWRLGQSMHMLGTAEIIESNSFPDANSAPLALAASHGVPASADTQQRSLSIEKRRALANIPADSDYCRALKMYALTLYK